MIFLFHFKRQYSQYVVTFLTSFRDLIQTLSHPSAILDLHFIPNDSRFAVVSSTGTISIYSFQSTHKISLLFTHQAFDPALLILSFTWHPDKSPQPLLAATLSDGTVHLLQFSADFGRLHHLNDSNSLNEHTLEAWTCAFAVSERKGVRIYSGGDDGKLRLVELESIPRMADEGISTVQTIPASVFKGHEAGVTAILPLPVSRSMGCGDLLLTGSYDDHVRVYTTYDSRSNAPNTAGKALVELKIGGGVWRLKLLDDYSTPQETEEDAEVRFRVLASCMHAGARILDVRRTKGGGGEWSIDILGSVTVHESMNYGSDVQPIDGGKEPIGDLESLCVSTSFYDRLVCVWRFNPKAI